jgi:hypothetical protein
MSIGLQVTSATKRAANAAAKGITFIEDYRVLGLEMELAGIYPHPTDDALYFVATNKNPVYQASQRPMLPVQYRGKLLTVNRHTGHVTHVFDLVDGAYGGIAYGENHLFVVSLAPPEILKVEPTNGEIKARIPISAPAGGLEYDKDRAVLIAQIFVSDPHLAVIDPKSGVTVETLWSDENAMGLAKVNGDLLCTWASGFDEHAFSELRLLDQTTGKVTGRLPLEGVHTSLAPLHKGVAGVDGFISLVSVDRASGKVAIRKYGYTSSVAAW